jgi:ADP-ribosyl-[dinitrogen reductase] hydrolase
MTDAFENRALGAFLGLAVGDALGTTLEFSARDSQAHHSEMTGGGPFRLQPGVWTDDTQMALALADSLLACEGLDEHDLMNRFLSWYRDGEYSPTGRCFDIGIATSQALNRFERTGDPIGGSTDPLSAGNGCLMRLAPVALFHADDEAAAALAAERQSATTHAAAECVEASAWFARLLVRAIQGRPKTEVLATPHSGSGKVAALAAGSWRGKERAQIRSSGYVIDSLEAALWAVGTTATFEDAVALAVNLGDDADTVGAITGQLAGAVYGAAAIPDRWLAPLAWRDRLESTALALAARQDEPRRCC